MSRLFWGAVMALAMLAWYVGQPDVSTDAVETEQDPPVSTSMLQ